MAIRECICRFPDDVCGERAERMDLQAFKLYD